MSFLGVLCWSKASWGGFAEYHAWFRSSPILALPGSSAADIILQGHYFCKIMSIFFSYGCLESTGFIPEAETGVERIVAIGVIAAEGHYNYQIDFFIHTYQRLQNNRESECKNLMTYEL